MAIVSTTQTSMMSNIKNESGAPFLTEKDLLRQIASNYTKDQLTSKTGTKLDEKAALDGKSLMKFNYARCLKVWTSFTRFIISQVIEKQRTVDTILIGLFYRASNNRIGFMPAPDFIEAGKFKLQRGAGVSMVGNDHVEHQPDIAQRLYFEGYDQFLKDIPKNELAQLSFGSLAVVSQVSQEMARRILTDFFQGLVEVSRRTKKEVRMNFSTEAGYLHLYQNRELAFHAGVSEDCPSEIYNARKVDRDDISFIDNASAILSLGGGKAFSVKSSRLSMASIVTPPTNISVASSAFASRRYDQVSNAGSMSMHSATINSRKSRKEVLSERRSEAAKSRKSALSKNGLMSIQNPSLANSKQNLPSLTKEHANTIEVSSSKASRENKTLAYPYLSAMVEPFKPLKQKRMVFDHTDYTDLLSKLQVQIDAKEAKRELEKIDGHEKDQVLIDEWRQKLYEEAQHVARDKNLKIKALKDANKTLVEELVAKRQNAEEERLADKLNYFPFTHGDLIEKQRATMNDLHKQDLDQAKAERQYAKDMDARHKRQAMLNAMANDKLVSLPSYYKEVQPDTPQKDSQYPEKEFSVIDDTPKEKSLKEKLVADENSSRRHVHAAMEEALDRYGEHLQRIEDEKAIQARDQQWRIQADEDIYEAQRLRDATRKQLHNEQLQVQIEQERERKRYEREFEKIDFGKTSGGPRSDPNELEEFEQLLKAKQDPNVTKEELKVQMQAKQNDLNNTRVLEMEIAQKHAQEELERIQKEDQALKDYENKQKEEFKHAWKAQQQLNKEQKKVEVQF